MLAVLLANEPEDALRHNERTPAYLLRLGDRPFLQYVVEALVLRGITQIEFVFSDSTHSSVAYFGDGLRWGCQFNFHFLSKAGLKPVLRAIAADAKGPILLGRADQFPAFACESLEFFKSREVPLFLQRKADEPSSQNVWTGWALFPEPARFLDHLDRNTDRALLADLEEISIAEPSECLQVQHEFSARCGKALLGAQKDLLSGQFADLQVGGRQTEPGVWMGRNVCLHPTAKISAPVYLGANSQVGANAQVGPFSVVAEDCIVGAESSVIGSLINAGSYVGESLEIIESIVDHEQIMDIKSGILYRLTDPFLLGSLVGGSGAAKFVRALCDRVVAAILLILFCPFMLLLLWMPSKPDWVVCDEVVSIPHEQQRRWKSFFLYRLQFAGLSSRGFAGHFLSVFLPGLLSVLKGDLALVGVQPRSAEEVERMPKDWQALYLKAKAGLVTDAVVHFDTQVTEDELRASECYYSATQTFSHDLKLLGAYLRKLAVVTFDNEHQR